MSVLKFKNICIMFCVTSSLISLEAQTNFGLGISNYSSSFAVQINPAEAGRMKHHWFISPFSINSNIHNNYLALNLPYSPYRILNRSMGDQYKDNNGVPFRNWKWVSRNGSVDKMNLYGSVRIQGPAIFVRKKNFAFGISQEVNIFSKATGVPIHLVNHQLKVLQEGKSNIEFSDDIYAQLTKTNDIQVLQNAYNSINLTLSRNFELKNDRNLSFGLTYKIINSLGGVGLQVKSDGLNLVDSTKDLKFSAPTVRFTEYYARNNKLKAHGRGAMDIGFVYTYRNKETLRRAKYLKRHTDYKVKVGMSILDIGNLIYTRTISTSMESKEDLGLSILEQMQNGDPQEIFNELQTDNANTEPNLVTIYGDRLNVGLPTRLMAHLDFQLIKRFYLNILVTKGLRKKSVDNLYSPSLFQITPRFESRFFEIGLPVSIREVRPTITQGVTLRAFNFFISTQNIVPFFKPKKISEASVFFGVQFSNLPGRAFRMKYGYRKFSKKGCSKF